MSFTQNGPGIDTSEERELFTYRPDIRHQYKKIISPYGEYDLSEEQIEANRNDMEVQEYIEGLLAIDDAYDKLFDILDKQQKDLELEIDSNKFPQVADAIACLSGGKQNTTINYDIYRASSNIVNDRVIRQVYTDDPVRGISDVDELRSRRDRQNKNIADKIFNLAVRKIGAGILRLVGKATKGTMSVASVGVGSAIAKILDKLADKLDKKKLNISEFNAAWNFADTVIAYSEDKKELDFQEGSNLNDDVADIGDTALFECMPHAQVVDEYIRHAAMSNQMNAQVNPAAFLERRPIEMSRINHEQTKGIAKTGIANLWRGRDDLAEVKKRINESGWMNVQTWLGPDIETLQIKTRKSTAPFDDSFAVNSLKDYGYKRLLQTLNAMSNDLSSWFTDPVVLCCFIKSAIITLQIDASIIKTLRIGLVFRKNKMQRNIDGMLQSGSNMITDILQGLAARAIASIDIAISAYIGKFRRAAQDKLNVTGCVPWDRFVGEVFYTLAAMEQELMAMLTQYTSKLKIGEMKLFEHHTAVQEQGRINFLLKLFDVLMELLELEQICVAGDEAVSFSSKSDPTRIPATPTLETGFVSGELDDTGLNPQDVITVYERMGIDIDPSIIFGSGKEDPAKATLSEYNNKAFLDKCGDALSAQNVREISATLRGFETSSTIGGT